MLEEMFISFPSGMSGIFPTAVKVWVGAMISTRLNVGDGPFVRAIASGKFSADMPIQ
jgi:hypothetical protein